MTVREEVDPACFNPAAELPYLLRLKDFEIAMQDVYDFFFDVNSLFLQKGLPRLDDLMRPANMSGLISDMLTSSVAKHSRSLVQNKFHNGHPDLIVAGMHPMDSAQAADEGVEIRANARLVYPKPRRSKVQIQGFFASLRMTKFDGGYSNPELALKPQESQMGAVDTHGGRNQWMCAFVCQTDDKTEPAHSRAPMRFTEIYLSKVSASDFRTNERGTLGTRTSTLDRDGIKKLRANWVYKVQPA